jgi:hypothetical protein
MEKVDLEKLEVFCSEEECVEQVLGQDNKFRPQKRRMQFTGYSMWGAAIYKCPVCDSEKRYKERTFGTGYTDA